MRSTLFQHLPRGICGFAHPNLSIFFEHCLVAPLGLGSICTIAHTPPFDVPALWTNSVKRKDGLVCLRKTGP